MPESDRLSSDNRDRTHFQVHRFQRPKGPLDLGQVLVSRHRSLRRQRLCLDARADDIQPIQRRFRGDLFIAPPIGERVVFDGQREVLLHFGVVQLAADTQADLLFAAQGPPFARYRLSDRFQLLLGGREQLLALACPFIRQQGIAARHQTLARIVGRADFRQVPFVKQRRLNHLIGHQLLDAAVPQRGDPIQSFYSTQVRIDPFAGDHAAIADQHHPPDAETLADLADLGREGRRIGRLGIFQPQFTAQAVLGRFRPQARQVRQLRSRRNDPQRNHGDDQFGFAAGLGREQPIEPDLLERTQDGGHMTVRQAADDVEAMRASAGSGSPASRLRITAIKSSGSAERLATVTCLTFPPSRNVRRSRWVT